MPNEDLIDTLQQMIDATEKRMAEMWGIQLYKKPVCPHQIDPPFFVSSKSKMQAEKTNTAQACILFGIILSRQEDHFRKRQGGSFSVGISIQHTTLSILKMKWYEKQSSTHCRQP